MKVKYNGALSEILAKWYLRFNGYFTVDNFIVHAGDDPSRISRGNVGAHTEIDVLGFRNKWSQERTGELRIHNDSNLLHPNSPQIDFVVVEVKTGSQTKPNKFWVEKDEAVLRYILSFAGFLENPSELNVASAALAQNGRFDHPNNRYGIRLLIISERKLNKNWSHIKNILVDDIIDFVVDIRGTCWAEKRIGAASIHYQWDPLIRSILSIANDFSIPPDSRKAEIRKLIS